MLSFPNSSFNPLPAYLFRLHFFAESKVREHHVSVLVQQDVLQLDVSVDHTQLQPEHSESTQN